MIEKNKMGGKKMRTKKITKKFLTFFLAMLMLITSLPFQIFANNNENISRSMGANPNRSLLTPAEGVMHAPYYEGARKAVFRGSISKVIRNNPRAGNIPIHKITKVVAVREIKRGLINIKQRVLGSEGIDLWEFTIEYPGTTESNPRGGNYSADLYLEKETVSPNDPKTRLYIGKVEFSAYDPVALDWITPKDLDYIRKHTRDFTSRGLDPNDYSIVELDATEKGDFFDFSGNKYKKLYLAVNKHTTKKEIESQFSLYGENGIYDGVGPTSKRWNKLIGFSPSFDQTFPLGEDRTTRKLTAQYRYTGPNYDLQTDENVRPDVPDNFVKVTFVEGDHGKLYTPGLGNKRVDKLVYFVNPKEEVKFYADLTNRAYYRSIGDPEGWKNLFPFAEADENWEFVQWDDTFGRRFFKEGDTVNPIYKYVGKDVVEQKNGTPKPDVPDNFKLVEFFGDEDGHILITPKEISKFWVNPENEVTLTDPKTKNYPGYEFDGWDKELTQTFTTDTIIKAKAKEVMTGLVNPNDPLNPDTNNFWTVKFVSDDESKGTIGIANTVYVPKSLRKTLADIVPPTPNPANGFRFKEWSPKLDEKTKIDNNIEVKAIFASTTFDPEHVEEDY